MTADARRPVIAVVGAGQARPEDERASEQVGRLLAERGAVLLCGGRGGAMDAACRGAAQGVGISIGLLPGEDALDANPNLTVALPTGLGHVRAAVVVLAASAVIAVGGGTGTLSEIALGLRSGKRVIGLGTWEARDASGTPAAIRAGASPQEAVDLALGTGLPGQDGGP